MVRIAGITAMPDIQGQIEELYLCINDSSAHTGSDSIGDGIWGSICGVIGSGIGIAAACMEDRSIFKALYIAHSTLVSLDELTISESLRLNIQSAIGICLSFCAMSMTACGLAYSFGYFNWTVWGIWLAEGFFLLCKIILNIQID